ncbi:MAG: Ig-like domain-containing protein [Bacteroidota bacterium]|nr:Ig-like domain-containing protein [Bacteroidota bacterium]
MKGLIKIVLSVVLILVFTQCAQVVPLNGGKKDVTAPKLLQAIPVNKSLNFNTDIIILNFDEFVQVKDIVNQLIVSPKLKNEPEIVADGKKIKIKLKKEELLPNTTYRFYFGKSIADMHEGNILQNFDYVFSTGTFIDTLKLKGKVVEEVNAKPIQDMIISLYNSNEVLRDSLCYTTIPNYVSRTNENGEFIFENLPYKEFKVIAFTDKNKNYLYDGEIEKIAFRDSNLVLKNDTTIHLKAFQEEANKTFIKKISSPYYGYSAIVYNKRSKIETRTLSEEDSKNVYFPLNSIERDTIEVFYKSITDTFQLISHNLITKKIDTLSIIPPKQNTSLKKLQLPKFNINGNKLPLNNSVELTFLNLMDTAKINSSKIKITCKEDSTINQNLIKHRWISPYKLQLQTKLKEGLNYQLKIDSAVFYTENKIYNDSIVLDFKTESRTDFGKLILKLLLNKKQNYLVQLINEKEQIVRETYIELSLAGSNARSIDFIDVPPANYQVKIIFDDNENKKWDTGNYLLNHQPERVIIHSKVIKVVSDWEVEEEIIIKE